MTDQKTAEPSIDITLVPNFFLRQAATSVMAIKHITEVYEQKLLKAMDECMCLECDKEKLKADVEAVLSKTKELEESALIISSCLERMSVVEEGDGE